MMEVKRDFHGLKTLFRQLLATPDFESNAPQTFFSDLADHVLERNGIGCVVKVEGEEDPDPYAIVTAVGLHDCFWEEDWAKDKAKTHPTLAHLRSYITGKDKSGKLAQLLEAGNGIAPRSNKRQTVAFLFSSRLVNMPPEIAPPMHKSLLADCAHAVSVGEKEYDFGYAVYICRTYLEEPAEDADGDEAGVNISATTRPSGSSHTTSQTPLFFHPEDDTLAKNALLNVAIRKPRRVAAGSSDAGDGNGVGRVMLVLERKGWEAAVRDMEKEVV
ncbi:hypothetical protein M427DRAFT_160170 [Gonapodya prolifera JEL478]|uniref:Uncharacterized protein n=1 Tax=Gonapodya prolifera (strain JEL478) TaxID=1344416 RepID=A0A138ZZ80_GONPJ|nr:hypothetical protein M427DRAFT_160170 [Gonapodya prolifera JEL478]|eukprot:KXS09817.1 hypothetical protein M427DRAFT_160170 [Gonapodya prolifera JEL478]